LDSEEATSDIVRRAQEGDASAAAQLYAKYADDILRFVRARLSERLRTRVESGDVTQEAYLAAMRSLPAFSYQGPGSFLRWLRTLAENQIRMLNRYYFQTQKRAATREQPLRVADGSGSGIWCDLEADQTDAVQELQARERSDLVQRLIGALPEDYAAVIRLTALKGITITEAAKQLDRTPDAARKLLVRALARCAEMAADPQFRGLCDYAER